MPHRVWNEAGETSRVERGIPLVSAPVVQARIAATATDVDKRRVDPPRMLLERGDDSCPKRNPTYRARLLPYSFTRPSV
jgi:hypothetical protein